MPAKVAPKVLNWASVIDENTIQQAARTSRLPFIEGHVALMPDAHLGAGSTVGSVIPTKGAIIPSAIGVDIGCGMVASETNLTAEDLPDDLSALMPLVEQRIPAGVGKGHKTSGMGPRIAALLERAEDLSPKQERTAAEQFGTLGSGNHFVEVCLDERGRVWTVLHSGSRGIGNQIAKKHIENAKGLMRQNFIKLEDPDLAYLVQGSPDFWEYIRAMWWAQDYARDSRERMNSEIIRSLFSVVGRGQVEQIINCHHNFTQQENHNGKDLWITRKGAIKADRGDLGVIPGSMGSDTYIIKGCGNPASWNSCAHGAGRLMSRSEAKRQLTARSLVSRMGDITWNLSRAESLVDEHPSAYKSISQVMEDQRDLVEVQHVLTQIFNYKG